MREKNQNEDQEPTMSPHLMLVFFNSCSVDFYQDLMKLFFF